MTDNFKNNLKKDAWSDPRISASEGASISFKPPGSDWEYQIRLRDFSAGGVGLLVNKDSDLLKYIRKGDIFSVNYHEEADPMTVQSKTVEVRHISFPANGMPENHLIVGLSFCEKERDS